MRRAFTAIELIAVTVIALLLVVIAIAALTSTGPRRTGHGMMKDSTQIRGIAQSLVVWANSNNGNYPLPSEIDLADLTVPEQGRAKDTTANIISILIWNGHISPELCISPAESNTAHMQKDEDYEYTAPKRAASPAGALWDPAFSADFSGTNISNNSYAYLQPSGSRGTAASGPSGRLTAWRDTFSTTEAILGNRSPEISSVSVAGDATNPSKYTVTPKNPTSETYLIHGGRSTWEGYIAFNDGSVHFLTTLRPEKHTYTSPSGSRLDTFFFDEPDDAAQANLFLGVFTTAGDKPSDFYGIWD